MMLKQLEHLDPDIYGIQVNETWCCWNCGRRIPVMDNRWCSAACKKQGEAMLIESPTPREIAQATNGIRAHWTPDEAATRAIRVSGEVRMLFKWLAT